MHEGIDAHIVGVAGQHQLAVAESVRHCRRHVVPGQVVDGHCHAPVRQIQGRFLRMSVDGCIRHYHAVLLRLIGRPFVIQPQIILQVLLQHRPVERTDLPNLQPRRLLQHVLHLGAILPHDADIIPPGLIRPVLLHVQSPELPEAVRREQHLVRRVIGHHHLGPVHHGRAHEAQLMPPQIQLRPVCHGHPLHLSPQREELVHHLKGRGGSHHLGLRILFQEKGDTGRVIRLHMLHHQVIRPAPSQGCLHVPQPQGAKPRVHGIHHRDPLVQYHIGIVGHPARHLILPLEQIHLVIVHAYIQNIVRHLHLAPPRALCGHSFYI